MPAVFLNDLWQLKVYSYNGAQIGINGLYYQVTQLTGIVTSAQWLANVAAALATDYRTLLAPTADLTGFSVQRILPLPKTLIETSVVGAGVGTATGNDLPKQVSGIVTFRTDFAGPANRGRNYFPFPGADDNTVNGAPTAGYLTKLGIVGNLFRIPYVVAPGGGATATFTRVLWPYGFPIGTTRYVTSHVVRPRWATQRRRGDYGQTNALFP